MNNAIAPSVKIQHFGADQVMITSSDQNAAHAAAERYMGERTDRSWKVDPVAVGRHGGAYVDGVGLFLTS